MGRSFFFDIKEASFLKLNKRKLFAEQSVRERGQIGNNDDREMKG